MSFSRGRLERALWLLAAVLALLPASQLLAQYQRQPPDFGGSYFFPTPTHPEPRADWVRMVDVGMLVLGLALAAYLVLRRRSRAGVVLLSLGAVAYFGFYRKGCICPIGAIQNVTLCLADPRYLISPGVIAFFFLPLAAALLFGRVFCSGVCPLGAVQELVLLRPVKVPPKLDRRLGLLPYAYLAVAVVFAGWGLDFEIAGLPVRAARRFLICEWDPFIGLFRISGPFHMMLLGAAFVLLGTVVGRPYCRWLCPYGALLSVASRVAWRSVSITPDRELDCGLCAEACPYGAIEKLRAQRSSCVACARCYASCPRELELRGSSRPRDALIQVELR